MTVPEAWEQLPCDAVVGVERTPLGNVSARVTPVAPEGPALVTVSE